MLKRKAQPVRQPRRVSARFVPSANHALALAFVTAVIFTSGCRVPVIDRGRNIIDGVPVLGSDVCCPPEQHQGVVCRFGRCDRDRYGPRPIHGDPLADKVVSWHEGPDCDGRWLVLERLIGRRRIGHCNPLLGWLGIGHRCEPGVYAPPRTPADEQWTLDNAFILLTLSGRSTLDGLDVKNDDIVAYDGHQFAKFFDGSDVGLSDLEIDAFAMMNDSQLLISFSQEFTVDADHALPGMSGTVDDSDVLLFDANSLGEITRGVFSMYLDGSKVGLDTDEADIDALAVLPDGRMIISTVGNVTVHGIDARDEDLLALSPRQTGLPTESDWKVYFDGSDAELATESSEDIDAVAIDGAGNILLSTRGDFAVGTVKGSAADVVVFELETDGSETRGHYADSLFFSSAAAQLSDNDISAIDLPVHAWYEE